MNREFEIWRVFTPLLTGDPAAFLSRLRVVDAEPQEQIAFLVRHGLLSTIRGPLQENDLWAALPDDLVTAVRVARRVARVRAIESLELMAELGESLAALDIHYLYLKGALLAKRFYGEIDSRQVGDIDLLIPPSCVDRVEQLLLEDGFEKRYGMLWGKALSRHFTHHIALARGRHMIEPHWTPAREPGLRIDLDRLFRERDLVEERGHAFPVPSTEATLLIQSIAVLKDLALGSLRLRSLVDIFRVAQAIESSEAQWPTLLETYETQGARRLATTALALSLRLLESEPRLTRLDSTLTSASRGSTDDRHPTLGLRVFDLDPPAWDNKRRVFRLYRGGSIPAWCWWAVSAPWRKAVYGP